MAYAAPGDTWGIPPLTFLAYFIVAFVAILVCAAIHRRFLFAGPSDVHLTSLGAQQVAYLNGGNRIAIYASLAGLRAAGALSSSGKTLVQSGPMPSGLTPLDSAIYQAAGKGLRVRDLTRDQWVTDALAQLRDGLERTGMMASAGQRAMARLWALPLAVLALVGIARAYDGNQNGKPITYITIATIIVVIATLRNAFRRGVGPTRAAQRAMREIRQRHSYLAPNHSPSYATYGATGAAMGVALYGGMSLYAMDPVFASQTEIQRHAAASGYSGSSSGGSSCGSSSDSGGGSSCGGGGGCGGGGCGG